jgi:Ni/Co efflux regulator RcnB
MLLSIGLAGAVDVASAQSSMTTGTARPAQSGQGWGNVPDLPLNPPTPPAGGSWGPGGWQNDGPARRMDAPEAVPGTGDRTENRQAQAGGSRGRGGDGPNYGPGGTGWTGRYNRVGRGYVVPGYLRAPNFSVGNWWNYGLARPAPGQTWIRYYDDALLIDGSGRVVNMRYGLDWDRTGPPPGYPDYGYGSGYQPGNYDRGFRSEDVQIYRSGPAAPNVTVHRGQDGSTVVVVQNPPSVTIGTVPN